jgi:broad specificity phosphatase PhoE
MNSIIIVKHGERLDEVQPNLWASYCEEHCENTYDYNCRVNDPPLASSGNRQAQNVGVTLRSHVHIDSVEYIFSSKLLRCVETAREIALVLNKPIVLSKTFSLNSKGVQQLGYFDFLSVEDIQSSYPDVTFIDGDDDAEGSRNIPGDLWTDAVQHVMASQPLSVVICHGETIRAMAKCPVYTPCCSFGVFRFHHGSAGVCLEQLCDSDGTSLNTLEITSATPAVRRKRKSPEDMSSECMSAFTRVLRGVGATVSEGFASDADEEHTSRRSRSENSCPHSMGAIIGITHELECAELCVGGDDLSSNYWQNSPTL